MPTDQGAAAGRLEAAQVQAMFDRVSGVYDLINGVMTAGLHHRWRERAVDLAQVGPGSRVLDVACGTGDLTLALARRLGGRSQGGAGELTGGEPLGSIGEVIGSDFSESMLARARAKAQATATRCEPRFEWGDAMALPYPDDRFDAATVGFGARNFSDLQRGLQEMARVVRPGGRVVVLEITRPTRAPLSLFYGLWFDQVVPIIGRLAGLLSALRPRGWHGDVDQGSGLLAGRLTRPRGGLRDEASPAVGIADAYTYLPSSVRRFPSPHELAAAMKRAGLTDVRFLITAGGIIAIHRGTVGTARPDNSFKEADR